MPGLTTDDVDHLFSYHPPKGERDVEAYQRIRDAGKAMAHVILEETPSSGWISYERWRPRDLLCEPTRGSCCRGSAAAVTNVASMKRSGIWCWHCGTIRTHRSSSPLWAIR